MKDNFGRPLSAVDSLINTMGEDWVWWLIPTRPVLNINYYERLYTLKQLKKTKGDVPDDDEFDIDRKFIAAERKIADVEKRILMGLTAISVMIWIIYGRHQIQ